MGSSYPSNRLTPPCPQSVNGMADWLAVRPETADGVKGTGASATRFK